MLSPRELPHEAAQRKLMVTTAGAEEADGDRNPMWTSKSFLGTFGDAFVQNTTLEGGRTESCIPEVHSLASDMIEKYKGTPTLSLFTEDDLATYETILSKYDRAAKSVFNGQVASDRFSSFLKERSNDIMNLAVGDYLLWCGGWQGTSGGHAIMYMVDRTSEDEVSWVTCNTGEGVGNHPGVASSKTKRHTCMRHNNIPIKRVADCSWLYYLFRITSTGHEDHGPEIFYEVVLPALLGTSLATATKDSGEDEWMVPETLQRSGVCYYRCILASMRYSMRRSGLNQSQVKQMLHVLRRGYVRRVIEDLEKSYQSVADENPDDPSQRGLYASQVRLVRLAANQLGFSAVKESKAGRMDEDTLRVVVSEVEKVETLVSGLPVFGATEAKNGWMEETLSWLSEGDPEDEENSAAHFSGPGHLTQSLNADLDSFQGDAKDKPQASVLDYSVLPGKMNEIDSCDKLVEAFENTLTLARTIRDDKQERIGSRLLELSSLIEYVMLKLIPLPEWDNNSSSWDLDGSYVRFYKLRDVLHNLGALYTSACESMKLKGSRAMRVLTQTAIACCFYHLIRMGPPPMEMSEGGDEEEPESQVLESGGHNPYGPYKTTNEYTRVQMDGAGGYKLTFDSKCHTKQFYDKLTIKDAAGNEQEFHGTEFPDMLCLRGEYFEYSFYTVSDGDDASLYGWKFTASAMRASEKDADGLSVDSEKFDILFSQQIREGRISFPTWSPDHSQDFLEIVARMPMDKPDMLIARARLCEYIQTMKTLCGSDSEALFGYTEAVDSAAQADHPSLVMFENLRELAAKKNVSGLDVKSPPNSAELLQGNQKKESLAPVQNRAGWLGLNRGEQSLALIPQVATMNTFYMARDFFARHSFSMRYVVTGGSSNVWTEKDFSRIAKWEFKFDKKLKSVKMKYSFGFDSGDSVGSDTFSPAKYPRPLCSPGTYVTGGVRTTTTGDEIPIVEDDILHEPILDDFNGNLSQEEAEILFTYLTAPYMRIPLVLEFFSRERVGCLFDPLIQDLLDSTIFVPGRYGSDLERVVEEVPCDPELLNTSHGYFFAELQRSPQITLASILTLLEDGLKLSVGGYKSSFVPVLLYLIRLNSKVMSFYKEMPNHIELCSTNEAVSAVLDEYEAKFADWKARANKMLVRWLAEAEADGAKYNSSVFLSHLAYTLWSNSSDSDGGDWEKNESALLISSVSFIRTWHVAAENVGAATEEDDGKENEKSGAAKSLGIPEQEMFWLVQWKRRVMLSNMDSSSDEELREVLVEAIQTATSDKKSYTVWPASNARADANVVYDQAGSGTLYRDDSNTFAVDLQRCKVSFKSSTLAPVPEMICRQSDFQYVFKNEIPHCADLIEAQALHRVHVVKGNYLVDYWQKPNGSEYASLPGSPCAKSMIGANTSVSYMYESKHFYDDGMDGDKVYGKHIMDTFPPYGEVNEFKWTDFPTKKIFVTFAEECSNMEFYDKFKIKVNDEWSEYGDAAENPWPKEPLVINGDEFSWIMDTCGEGSGRKDFYGFKIWVTAQPDCPEGEPIVYDSVEYGGEGRMYQYGQDAPEDLPWLPSILDPVLKHELTDDPKNGHKIKWKKYELSDDQDASNGGDDKKKKKNSEDNFVVAVDFKYILPSTPVNGDATQVILLGQHPKKSFWYYIKVYKILQLVEVYTIRAWGRRTYPSLIYTSDSRFSLGMHYMVKASLDTLMPHASITRFSTGEFLMGGSGGKNVIITNNNEGDDGLGPRTYLPREVTSSLIPYCLASAFDFWELKRTGSWTATTIESKRRDEKGKLVSYVDSFFDYGLETSIDEKGRCSVIRKDIDPVTNDESGRRLVNLKNSKSPICGEIIKLVTQIEGLSFVLAWSKIYEEYDDAFDADEDALMPVLIELPRLYLKLEVCITESGLKLVVVDSGGKYVLSQQNNVINPDLIAGVPRYLLLGDNNSSVHILVPNCPLLRPKVSYCPFTVSTIPDCDNDAWKSYCHARYYLYEVHSSDSFVLMNTVGATIYWAYMKLLHREYTQAYTAIVSCGTDMPLSMSEMTMLSYFATTEDDYHPDAHACRLKMRLVLQHSPIYNWPFCPDKKGDDSPFVTEYASYLTKRQHVSLACRLTEDEELLILKHVADHKLARGYDALMTRESAIRTVEANPDAQEYIAYFNEQTDGGQKFTAYALTKGVSSQQLSTDWQNNTHSIGQMNIHSKARAGPNGGSCKGREALSLVDDMWSMKDIRGGLWPIITAMCGGHVLVDISSMASDLDYSNKMLAEMITRVHTWKNGFGEDNDGLYGLMVSNVLAASAGCDMSFIKPFPDKFIDLSVPTYFTSGYDDEEDLFFLRDYLRPNAEEIGQISGYEGLINSKYKSASNAKGGDEPTADTVKVPSNTVSIHVGVSNYAKDLSTLAELDLGDASITSVDVEAWMSQPLKAYVNFDDFVTEEDMPHDELCPESPPYDLSGNVDAETVVAQQTQKRISDDCVVYAETVNSQKASVLVGMSPSLMAEYAEAQQEGGVGQVSPAFADDACARLEELKSILENALETDQERMRSGVAYLVERANYVPESVNDEILRYKLNQSAGLRVTIEFCHLVACMVSTNSQEDILAFNPYVEQGGLSIDDLLNATAGIVMISTRINQLRRALSGVADVMKAIARKIDARNMQKEIDGLLGNLLAARYYAQDGTNYDPRFLIFEYLTGYLLRKAQVYLAGVFIDRATKGGQNEWGQDSESMVHQMIMGAGKTTVIGPLLALMLADSKCLVTQVVPNALLDMSRNVMWKQYCQVIVKPVYTLTFDRSWPANPITYERMHIKMLQARKQGGIVVTTPSAIKSIVNKYVELLNVVATVDDSSLLEEVSDEEVEEALKNPNSVSSQKTMRRLELKKTSDTADAIAKVINLWSNKERGVLLLDEVDMLLHPLRSELNFPIGEKFPLAPSPSRWDLPIYLLDVVLKASNIAMGVVNPGDNAGDSSLQDLVDVINQGLADKVLQRTPHIVLLDHDFYNENLKPAIVAKALSWMQAHHTFEGLECPPLEELLEYCTRGNSSSSVESIRAMEEQGNAGKAAVQVLNMAYDWVSSFIPHILAKVDRVSFGLLQPQDEKSLSNEQPLSRKLLGIPFVGKDVPSGAAEFAQPDVLIGATIMAYRYEGLRRTDLKTVCRLVKENLQQEAGPKKSRPAYQLFEGWINGALTKYNLQRTVTDLEMFQLADKKQMEAFFQLMHMEPSIIHYYLREVVFPKTMKQQRLKISSSGQELGSDMLFGRRLGFSGTPSNLLPVEIVPCHFEKGSEGKILRTLTDATITMEAKISRDLMDGDEDGKEWTVKGVLDSIAQSQDPPFHALIDTGALITGYSNEEVARYLIDTGLKHVQGCVFLDHLDRKMIYLRGAARCIPLSECGLGKGNRFTFYDQVHTTGMDIKQQISACAVLTIGKDMIFRDYAQGAYRMRGIGQGQTIHLFITPEIKKMIKRTLPRLTGDVEDDVAAWLQLNGMKTEKLQFLQLCSQNMQTIWRKTAINNLLSSSGMDRDMDGDGGVMPTGLSRFVGDEANTSVLCESMRTLKDIVNFDIPDGVPDSEPYAQTLQKLVDDNSALVTQDEQKEVVRIVMKQVDDVLKSGAESSGGSEKKGLNSEMTREKEREQEQQKQKQQQQQTESMFAKDKGRPYQWKTSLLDDRPMGYDEGVAVSEGGSKWEEKFPFYPLSVFSPRPKDFKFGKVEFPRVEALAFPQQILQSTNFAPIGRDLTKPLKLKNVNIVLDWVYDEENHRTVVLTLSEAESMRRYIQNKQAMGDEHSKFGLVMLPAGIVLEATQAYIKSDALSSIMSCMKFWNNEMFFKENETQDLLNCLSANEKDQRREFFEASLTARRRSRSSWIGTPIRTVFAFRDDEEFNHLLELVERIRTSITESGRDIMEVCLEMDADGNGFLSADEISAVLDDVGVTNLLPSDVDNIAAMMDTDGDNAIEYEEFAELFQPHSSTSERATIVQNMMDIKESNADTPAPDEEARAAKREEAAKKREERQQALVQKREEARLLKVEQDKKRLEEAEARKGDVEAKKIERAEKERAKSNAAHFNKKSKEAGKSNSELDAVMTKFLQDSAETGDEETEAMRVMMESLMQGGEGMSEADMDSFAENFVNFGMGNDDDSSDAGNDEDEDVAEEEDTFGTFGASADY